MCGPGGESGDPKVCGAMTSGGSESILTAVKAARDWARATRGVRRPEMVVGVSAHAAFFKAAEYFGVRLVRVRAAAELADGHADRGRGSQRIAAIEVHVASAVVPLLHHPLVADGPSARLRPPTSCGLPPRGYYLAKFLLITTLCCNAIVVALLQTRVQSYVGDAQVPVGRDFRLTAAAVRRALTHNTALVVASTPCFPHGVIDDVVGIAEVLNASGCSYYRYICVIAPQRPLLVYIFELLKQH